jgi:hypothetical protein
VWADAIDDRWVFSVGFSDVDDGRALLRGVPGVKRLDRSDGRWLVHADRDIRIQLHEVVVRAGGVFTHLSRDRADLDAIYHRYFHADAEDDRR